MFKKRNYAKIPENISYVYLHILLRVYLDLILPFIFHPFELDYICMEAIIR